MGTQGEARPSFVRRVWKWVRRLLLALLALVLLALAVGLPLAWEAMGTAPDGERAERMARSPQWSDGVFVNPQPLWNDIWGSLSSFTELSDVATPSEALPVAKDTAERLQQPPSSLRVTWLGHSTVLIEIGNIKVLTDPIFGESPFPIPALGPGRWYEPPLPLSALKEVDVVLISHDHYDHLDMATIKQMVDWKAVFVCPLGVGAHLEYWGVKPERIVELDWWMDHTVSGVRITATPARHASGRHVFDQDRTLWAGYVIASATRKVMFSGDTGLFEDMKVIGERYGPFDVVMIEVGAYNKAWPDWHIGPEQAVIGLEWMRGKVLMPIHWGLFNLAMHGWTEPVERLRVAVEAAGVQWMVPRPGEVVDMDAPPKVEPWWPDVPWETAEEHPIRSTRAGDPEDRY